MFYIGCVGDQFEFLNNCSTIKASEKRRMIKCNALEHKYWLPKLYYTLF